MVDIFIYFLPAPGLAWSALFREHESCVRRQSLKVLLVIHLSVIIQQEDAEMVMQRTANQKLRLAYDNILQEIEY